MARYIDADKLCEALKSMASVQHPDKQNTILGVVSSIENFPTADVVPKSEVDLYRKQVDELEDELASTYDKLENAKANVAREIFEEIWVSIAIHAFTSKSEDYANGAYDTIEWVDSKIAELKKKYTEDKE